MAGGYGMLSDYVFDDKADDIRGSSVFAVNEEDKFGKIKDVIFDQNTGKIVFLIVDAEHSKFLVPPEHVWEARHRANSFVTDLSRSQLDSLPTLNLDRLKHDNQRWRDYEAEYRASWPEWQQRPEQHTSSSIFEKFQDKIRAHRDRISGPEPQPAQSQRVDEGDQRKVS